MGILEVRLDVDVTAQTNGEWLVHDTQLVEVGLGEVGTELGLEGLVF